MAEYLTWAWQIVAFGIASGLVIIAFAVLLLHALGLIDDGEGGK